MTTGTTDTLMNMNAVIEIRKLRQVVNARPLERHARAETRANGFKHWTVRPNLRMTVHADLRRRYSGESRFFNRRVAITAVDSESADVMFVTERDWLFLGYADVSKVSRSSDCDCDPG